MIDKTSDIIYNSKFLIIVSNNDKLLIEGLIYSFNHVVKMNNSIEDINLMYNFITKNNFQELIFVDYIGEYSELINLLNGKYIIKFIFTKSISSLCDEYNYLQFTKIMEFYNQKITNSIAFLDKTTYDTLKEKYHNIYYLILDIPRKEQTNLNFDANSIGILNDFLDAKHSTYNELSAIKMLDMTASVKNIEKITKSFMTTFNIKYNEVKNEDNIFSNNLVNLYVNFTSNNPLIFIKSIDNGVPCIVGNNTFLTDDLNKLIAVNSDDDINEIKSKILYVKDNREKIFKESEKYRQEYSINSINSIKEFVGYSKPISKSYEKLLTVVVPVYNIEKYLNKCLDSIINAIVPKTEILIINDGSTDNSETIIKEYVEKYPDIIRYIKQENHGLGNVRNVALKESNGKYIASIDSDDSIDCNFFKEALPYIEKDIDIIIYDWLTITDDSKFETPAIDWVFKDINKYQGLLYTTIMPSTCNKIMKKSLFEELDIKYVEDKYEDLSTNPFIMLKANTIKYISKPYYEYYIRSSSIMRSSAGFSMIDILKEFDIRLNKYKNIINVSIDEFKFYTYSWRIEEYIFNQLYDLEEKELEKFINYIYDNIYDLVCDIFVMNKYKQVLNTLKDRKDKVYIENRNKCFKDKKLLKFILDSRKNNHYKKLTPPIIYYGE